MARSVSSAVLFGYLIRRVANINPFKSSPESGVSFDTNMVFGAFMALTHAWKLDFGFDRFACLRSNIRFGTENGEFT